MDYAALKTEITTDPKVLGLVAHYNAGDDVTVAALLNALTGAGAATITIPTYSSDAFSTGILSAIAALGQSTTALQTKWQYVLQTALTRQVIQYAAAAPLLAGLVADGLITQAQVDSFTTRTGSRAEVLWGAGTIVQVNDVSRTRSF